MKYRLSQYDWYFVATLTTFVASLFGIVGCVLSLFWLLADSLPAMFFGLVGVSVAFMLMLSAFIVCIIDAWVN